MLIMQIMHPIIGKIIIVGEWLLVVRWFLWLPVSTLWNGCYIHLKTHSLVFFDRHHGWLSIDIFDGDVKVGNSKMILHISELWQNLENPNESQNARFTRLKDDKFAIYGNIKFEGEYTYFTDLGLRFLSKYLWVSGTIPFGGITINLDYGSFGPVKVNVETRILLCLDTGVEYTLKTDQKNI